MHESLLEDAQFSLAVTPTDGAAGTTDINGAIIDMDGFDELICIVVFGAITATAVTSVKWQQGAASNMSDAADLEGTGITVADDDDEKLTVQSLVRPTERYVRVVVDRGTANAVVAAAVYIKRKAHEVPQTQASSDVIDSEEHLSPAEGTA